MMDNSSSVELPFFMYNYTPIYVTGGAGYKIQKIFHLPTSWQKSLYKDPGSPAQHQSPSSNRPTTGSRSCPVGSLPFQACQIEISLVRLAQSHKHSFSCQPQTSRQEFQHSIARKCLYNLRQKNLNRTAFDHYYFTLR